MINSKTQDLYQYHANDGSAKTDEVQPSSKKIIKNLESYWEVNLNQNMIIHIGATHMKVNEVLREKGVKPIEMRIKKNSVAPIIKQ